MGDMQNVLKISLGKNLYIEQLSVSDLFFKFGLNLRAYLWTEIEYVSLPIQIH